jgi:hypothetical protein
MTTASISQAQNKGLFATIRDFAIELYTAHGGWFAHDAATGARAVQTSRRQLLDLAKDAEVHSPSLAAELRSIASK